LSDLAEPGLIVAFRQRGSGTQVLLEHELRRAGLGSSDLHNDERTYTTHLAVAGAVAAGSADAGLGILGAARAYGLEFLPVTTERFELAVPGSLVEAPAMQGLLHILMDQDFLRTVSELGGYDVSQTGQRRWVT
jgi:putative molybdopterin biosynthesis protein